MSVGVIDGIHYTLYRAGERKSLDGKHEGVGETGTLESVNRPQLAKPNTAAPRLSGEGSARIAVIAHPWSKLGGSQRDHVVHLVKEVCLDKGYTVATFDFRGGFDQDVKDYERIVQDVLLPTVPHDHAPHVALIGYSYGSMVAAQAASHLASLNATTICISYPSTWSFLLQPSLSSFLLSSSTDSLLKSIPRLQCLLGSRDSFCSLKRMQQLVARPEQLSAFDTDHFWATTGARQQLRASLQDVL